MLPIENMTKINLDASIASGNDSFGIGWFARDYGGNVIEAYSKLLPGCIQLAIAKAVGVKECSLVLETHTIREWHMSLLANHGRNYVRTSSLDIKEHGTSHSLQTMEGNMFKRVPSTSWSTGEVRKVIFDLGVALSDLCHKEMAVLSSFGDLCHGRMAQVTPREPWREMCSNGFPPHQGARDK
uniref:RNase H type-1 domain-containing protein n=1 Tax=Cannabis sativa TaxID=3483 RepID=A0A803PE99_CANSA